MEHNQGSHGYQRTPIQPASWNNECLVREQDRLMPIANVIRIMRTILPSHAKIADDSKEIIQECVSEFVSFITGEANDRCQSEQRKTITAEDILWAMDKLGFDDYIEPLTIYLHRYREIDGGERYQSLRANPQAKGHHGFGAATVAAGFMKNSQNAGPSRSVTGFQPYAHHRKE